MASTVSEWLSKVGFRLLEQWWEEFTKVSRDLRDNLAEIWDVDVGDLFGFLFLGGATLIPGRLLATREAFQEWGQDTALIWPRIAANVIDEVIPVPDSMKNRVMRADEALRYFVQEALVFAINIEDLDLPAELDLGTYVQKYVTLRRVLDGVETIGQGARTAARGSLVLFIGTLMKHAAALGVVAWAGWVLLRAHQSADVILRERALPQDSLRVRRRRRGVRQYRLNRRPGPDQ